MSGPWLLSRLGLRLACSIVTICGLDEIKCSAFEPNPPVSSEVLHASSDFLPPLKSQIELGERIYALYVSFRFKSRTTLRLYRWSIFVVDRCGSICLDWNAAFDAGSIKTPLPRSWAEYENVGSSECQ